MFLASVWKFRIMSFQLFICNFFKLILALPTWGQKCTVSELYLTLLSFSSKVGFSEAGTSWQNRSFLSSVNTLKTSPFGSILKMRHQSTFSGTFPCYNEKKNGKNYFFSTEKKVKTKVGHPVYLLKPLAFNNFPCVEM